MPISLSAGGAAISLFRGREDVRLISRIAPCQLGWMQEATISLFRVSGDVDCISLVVPCQLVEGRAAISAALDCLPAN